MKKHLCLGLGTRVVGPKLFFWIFEIFECPSRKKNVYLALNFLSQITALGQLAPWPEPVSVHGCNSASGALLPGPPPPGKK